MSILFKVPIEGGGEFVATSPKEFIYLLSFASPVDNRTTTAFLAAYIKALDILEAKYEKGVVISTSSIAKFFSNGLDVDHTLSRANFFKDALTPLLRRLVTYVFILKNIQYIRLIQHL
jgi:enoyl-CoA hydratase/carnithine racemase